MNVNGYITDRDLVAARALLRWSAKDLCEKSDVGVATIRRFESGGAISEDRKELLIKTLTDAGVVFFGRMAIEGAVVSRGVALRPRAKPKPQKKLYYELEDGRVRGTPPTEP